MDPQFAIPEKWTPPAELARALPRETQLTVRGQFTMALAILFVIGAVPLYTWLNNQQVQSEQQNHLLRTEGVEARGEITRLWHRNRGREAMVGYVFTANGARVRGEAPVPSDEWPGIQKIGFMPIRYLPSNPDINHPARWEASTSPQWVQFVLPAMLLGGGGFLLWNLRRHSQLAAEGVPAPGVVNKCLRIKNGWIVRYQFRTKDGAVFGGRDRTYVKMEPGTAICVLYRTEDPSSNQRYPGGMYRVVTP